MPVPSRHEEVGRRVATLAAACKGGGDAHAAHLRRRDLHQPEHPERRDPRLREADAGSFGNVDHSGGGKGLARLFARRGGDCRRRPPAHHGGARADAPTSRSSATTPWASSSTPQNPVKGLRRRSSRRSSPAPSSTGRTSGGPNLPDRGLHRAARRAGGTRSRSSRGPCSTRRPSGGSAKPLIPADCLAFVAATPGGVTFATIAYAIPGVRAMPSTASSDPAGPRPRLDLPPLAAAPPRDAQPADRRRRRLLRLHALARGTGDRRQEVHPGAIEVDWPPARAPRSLPARGPPPRSLHRSTLRGAMARSCPHALRSIARPPALPAAARARRDRGLLSPARARAFGDTARLTIGQVQHGGRWNPRPGRSGGSAGSWRGARASTPPPDAVPLRLDRPGLHRHPMLYLAGDGADACAGRRASAPACGATSSSAACCWSTRPTARTAPASTPRSARSWRGCCPRRRSSRCARDHVLYKSFYLVDRQGGRVLTRPWLEAQAIDGRLAVVYSQNDLGRRLGALGARGLGVPVQPRRRAPARGRLPDRRQPRHVRALHRLQGRRGPPAVHHEAKDLSPPDGRRRSTTTGASPRSPRSPRWALALVGARRRRVGRPGVARAARRAEPAAADLLVALAQRLGGAGALPRRGAGGPAAPDRARAPPLRGAGRRLPLDGLPGRSPAGPRAPRRPPRSSPPRAASWRGSPIASTSSGGASRRRRRPPTRRSAVPPPRGGRTDLLAAAQGRRGGEPEARRGARSSPTAPTTPRSRRGSTAPRRAELRGARLPRQRGRRSGTEPPRDVAVERVAVDDFAFVRNTLTVEATLRVRGYAGRRWRWSCGARGASWRRRR